MVSIKTSAIKYKDCDIPAALFFDELMHGNISVIGKGSVEDINNAYWGIINEYCQLSGNSKMLSWFRKQNTVSKIQRAISDVNICLNSIIIAAQNTSEKKVLKPFIDGINKLEYPRIKFSYTKPIQEEIKRVRNSVIGALNNQLKMETINESNKKEVIKKDFMDSLVNIQNILGYQIDDNTSLRKYISYEKAAKYKINASKTKK